MRYTIGTTDKTFTYEYSDEATTLTLTHEVEGAEHILTCGREQLHLNHPESAMWIAEQWAQQRERIYTLRDGRFSLSCLHTLWCEHEKKVLQEMARKLAETRDYSLVGEWIGWSSSDTEGDTPRTTGIYRYEDEKGHGELVGYYMTGDSAEEVYMCDLLADALELGFDESRELAAELYAGWVASIK